MIAITTKISVTNNGHDKVLASEQPTVYVLLQKEKI